VVVKIRPRQTIGHDEHGTVNMDFFQYRETLTEAKIDDLYKKLEAAMTKKDYGLASKIQKQINGLPASEKKKRNDARKSGKGSAQKKLPEWRPDIEEYDDILDEYATDLAVARDTDDEDAEDMAEVDFEDHFIGAKKKGKIGKYTVRSVKTFGTLANWGGTYKYVIFITAGNKLSSRNCYVTGSDKDLDDSAIASLEQEMNKMKIK
jgi:hypothetical protein